MTTVEVLRKARALYEANPSHAPEDGEVDDGCVCLLTATTRAREVLGALVDRVDEIDADSAIRVVIGTDRVAHWNSEHTTEEVLAAFDRAIEASS